MLSLVKMSIENGFNKGEDPQNLDELLDKIFSQYPGIRPDIFESYKKYVYDSLSEEVMSFEEYLEYLKQRNQRLEDSLKR